MIGLTNNYLEFPRLPNFGAVMLERAIVASGGGPPLGCPLIVIVSPETT